MEWPCQSCSRAFGSRRALDQHTAALHHTTEIELHEPEDRLWCSDCQRWFQNQNNLKMHLNSRIHRGRTFDCPFCKSPYTTVAGLTHHLEAGSCPKAAGISRDVIYRAVRRLDPAGSITKKLIGWHSSSTYEATEHTWNGYYYECYLCHRAFKSLKSLNQHLQSPTHQQKLYRCPNHSGCGKEFTSLAGLCNHLESESCQFMRFEAVQTQFRKIVGADRLLTSG
ncbi:putative zinc finger protein [Rosellinia necatrix]|uniref:Putative zinc finger protein n=1 Tax=Rosellinia necatrix TaxID=77044 RepID=A0A1W2TRX3_ROSNE|nr:putative zinc finger protein [Rosellinia necatrix]